MEFLKSNAQNNLKFKLKHNLLIGFFIIFIVYHLEALIILFRSEEDLVTKIQFLKSMNFWNLANILPPLGISILLHILFPFINLIFSYLKFNFVETFTIKELNRQYSHIYRMSMLTEEIKSDLELIKRKKELNYLLSCEKNYNLDYNKHKDNKSSNINLQEHEKSINKYLNSKHEIINHKLDRINSIIARFDLNNKDNSKWGEQ